MTDLLLCAVKQHNVPLLALAALVCGLPLIIALHIHSFLKRPRGKSPLAWLVIAGLTAGFGLWAAHFILLLAHTHDGANHHGLWQLVSLASTLGATSLGFVFLDDERRFAWLYSGASIAAGYAIFQLGDLHFLGGGGELLQFLPALLVLASAIAVASVVLLLYFKIEGEIGRWSAALVMTLGLGAVHIMAMSMAGACSHSGATAGIKPEDNTQLVLMLGVLATGIAVVTGISAFLTGRRFRSRRRLFSFAAAPSTASGGAWRNLLLTVQLFARNPVIGFALALIVVIWGITRWQHTTERDVDLNDITSDAASMARIIGQNVQRTAGNLDTTLKYLRRTYERSNYEASWASLISDEYTNSELTVQIAAIDKRGMMISSSAMLYPSKPLDLSDREHFKALASATGDPLYISRPMIGRASGQRSVQLARRVYDKNREFNGIVVASLTTDYLTKSFGNEALGSKSGIALYGKDGIVRAGLGIFANAVEKPVESIQIDGVDGLTASHEKGIQASTRNLIAVATQPVDGYPLAVRVVLADDSSEAKSVTRSWLYFTAAMIATILVLYVALTSVYNREIYEARIVRLAHFDPLTGVSNRAQFKLELERAVRQRDGTPFALHLIDLDGFKLVNDTYGHPIGDLLLKGVTDRLRNSLRSYDAVARLGGDEFAVIQGRTKNGEDAVALARRICKTLADPFEIEGYTITIGSSIGIAMSNDADNASNLMKASDLALYEAKTAGRGTFKFYSRDMEAAFHARRELERDLQVAIAAEQFELYYQPIVDLGTGATCGYEALVRWHHPVKGFIPPADFIPVAEETKLIVPLGEWILRKACEDIAKCDPKLGIAVNCSTLQFRSANFVEIIVSALTDAGLAPQRLELEITESIFMSKDSSTIARLNELRSLGVRLALDDFGTGFSSLSYVMSYPFSTLKIDRSFTSKLGADDRGEYVVRAICALANSLGMDTVAEGVEDETQLAALKRLGCMHAQGYYFSKPKPARDILVPMTTVEEAVAA